MVNCKMIGIKIIFVVITLFIGRARSQNKYRENYELLRTTIGAPAFYKYHKNEVTWHEAKEICEMEGSTLFYPESGEQMNDTVWKNWIKGLNIGDGSNLHVGVSVSIDGKKVRTVDDKHFTVKFGEWDDRIDKVPTSLLFKYPDMSIGRYKLDDIKTTFMCKKPQAAVQWNDKCNMAVISHNGYDYEYNIKTGNCYKLHTISKTWEKAETICNHELSELVVLNNQEEANYVVEMVSRVPEEKVGVACLGFKLTKTGWRTLSGSLLKDSGYAMWAYTQPDGGASEQFGAMAYNGRLHDIAGDARCSFVCEHVVETS